MNEPSFYQKIKDEIMLDRLKIVGIIAPARVGSTFFMNVLAESPSVHGFINQPFHLSYSLPYIPPENRSEVAYQRIWGKYHQARELHSEKKIVLVLKCMARNLGIGDRAFRFIQLIDRVILLIRNPFLSIDSLLKEQVMSMEKMPEASQHNFDDYALQNNFIDRTGKGDHWQVLKSVVLKTKNYKIITDLLIETLAFIELNQYERDIINDYKCSFENDFNQTQDFFALSWTGWNNMAIIYEKLMSQLTNYLVVDSTILRCRPEKVCREISNALDIIYSPQMIDDWTLDRENIIDQTIIKTSWMQSCYDRVTSTSGIKPPHESPIPINLFPHIYQQHILNIAQPIYSSLLNNNHSIRPRSSQKIDELLNTTVTEDGKVLRQIDPIFSQILLNPVLNYSAV